MSLRLRTFGSVYISKDGAVLTGPAGQRRLLALLTVVASAGDGGISRDKVLGLLWSEGEPDKSRHALTQSLYHTRKALQHEHIFLSGGDLRINPDALSSDLADFQQAIDDGRFENAVDLYTGPFLDGFYLNGDPGFDFWVGTERARLARQYAELLSMLAARGAESGDLIAERRWRDRLVEHDPIDGNAVAGLMTCVLAAGDHAAALQLARAYEDRMRADLDLPPDPVVTEIVARVRRSRATPDQNAERVVVDTERQAARIDEPVPSSAAALEHSPVGVPTHTVAVPAGRSRGRSLAWIGGLAAMGAFAAVGVVTRVAASRLADDRAAVARSTIMVAPFRVPAADPSTAYLGEGLLDLLTTRIGDADTQHAADPARVLEAWKQEHLTPDSATSISAASRVAHAVGAGQVVIGSIERMATGPGILVHASLVDAAGGQVRAQTDVRGSVDSLIVLADRIISSLILKEFGEHVAGGQPMTASHLAVRAYLAGRSSYRHGDYYGAMRAYNRALIEEPGFALAALGLAMAADHVNVAEQHDRGLAVAWAKQNDLSPADRAYLRAFAGPRYPEPSSASEALAAWEHVVRVAPDRAEGWHQLGESFYYDGEALGMRDGPARAGAAFRHALELDPSFGASQRLLMLLLARQADTAALRQLLATAANADSADVTRVFVRWRAAQALNDRRELQRLRGEFEVAPNSALRAIAMTSQFDGVSISDGDRALEILRRRPLTDAEETDVALARHSRALNMGDFGLALAITNDLALHQPALHPQLRLRVLDALYSNGDRTAALAAANELEHRAAGPPQNAPADSAVRLADVCVLGQWRLSLDDTSGARDAVRVLRSGGALRFPVPVGANPLTCAELIDVSLAVAERGPAARERIAHMDSLMLSGPAVSDAMRYANLIVARQYQKIGDPTHALAALQRRSYMRGWPRYRATGLTLLMELARATGDTALERSARQRWLSTRTAPVVASSGSAFVHRLRAFSRRLVQ